jgi:PKD repeat protein
VKTPGGTAAPSADYTPTNPGAANGKLAFNPSFAITDSLYEISYRIYSFTTGCEAPPVKRYVFVAPRPVAGFTPSIACGGDKTQFTNNTTITSGYATYEWDFGDGSPVTDYINPDHLYAATGTYSVKLTAKSNYGYTNTFTMNVGGVQ